MTVDCDVPEEFRPKCNHNDVDNDIVEEDTLNTLFYEEQSDDDDSNNNSIKKHQRNSQVVTIAGDDYNLVVPPDIGTLFAHQVWGGSIVMAEFLTKNKEKYIVNKQTVELGAGTALPSLVSLRMGSKLSVITDYPDENLLQSLRETVGNNWQICSQPKNRVAVTGHCWGDSVDNVLNLSNSLRQDESDGSRLYFDVAILSECLWMHRTHDALVKSVDQLVHPKTGTIIATYAHHIPGCEAADDAFFDKCEVCGFTTIEKQIYSSTYMWDNSKTIPINLRVLVRSNNDTK